MKSTLSSHQRITIGDGVPMSHAHGSSEDTEAPGPQPSDAQDCQPEIEDDMIMVHNQAPSEGPDLVPANQGTAHEEPPAVSTDVSSRGRIRKPSRRMQESAAQREFHGKGYYAAMQAELHAGMTPDKLHDYHLDLQDRMRNPVAFHAEMMGDIMYYSQAMKQEASDQWTLACGDWACGSSLWS